MIYKNIMTLYELLDLISISDKMIIHKDKEINSLSVEEAKTFRVDLISSTCFMKPTKANAKYEYETEAKPEHYKGLNLLIDKDFCMQSKVIIYVSKITNEVIE